MQLEALDTLGYVEVSYPPMLRMRVREAMEPWRDFCALPLEEKQHLALSLGDRLKDVGYVLRQDKGRPNADNKEFFHVKRTTVGAMRERAVAFPNKRTVAFVDATDALLSAAIPLVQTFAEEVEARYHLLGFESEVMASQGNNWTFRYLHYPPASQSGEELAHAHTDRGGFTLHMYESHPGAEYYGFDRAWHPLIVNDDRTVIFPSMGLQYRSGGALKALCHQVVATPETAQDGRYSMVAFIDFNIGYRYDDSKKRLQEFPPGFNYDMPTGEFEELFVAR